MLRVYDRTLQWVLRYRPVTHGDLPAWCWRPPVYMFVKIPKGFIPDQDTDQIAVDHRSGAGHLVLPDGGVSAADRRDRQRRIRTWKR